MEWELFTDFYPEAPPLAPEVGAMRIINALDVIEMEDETEGYYAETSYIEDIDPRHSQPAWV